jgi:predicted N-acyltransferase
MNKRDYVTQITTALAAQDANEWDSLLAAQAHPTPFMRHAYLLALESSASACANTGWMPHVVTLRDAQGLAAACVVYAKTHSYGEYVFDWAWANAYAQHGLDYYPKALVAVPFTPVPGTRLLARDAPARLALVQALMAWCEQQGMSSLHLLFADALDTQACAQAGLMLRHGVQFHWTNSQPGYPDFEAFLATLTQEKRKKIRQERRKVSQAGVQFRHAVGTQISEQDWDFFYHCYHRTYLEHGNAPYLSRDFFRRMASDMPAHWLLFIAERGGQPIASSLIALDGNVAAAATGAASSTTNAAAYGRYWGALERVDCLHFEACYYQPLEWCIANGYSRFEGGAQGEHKMARALLPTATASAHWIAHPAFAQAIEQFLEREGEGVANYLEHLNQRSPLRNVDGR